MVCLFYVGCWVRGSPLDILAWKMDAKRFEEAHACALAQQKPLMPPITLKSPSSSHEPLADVVDRPSDRSTSSLWKKFTGKKRKAANSSTSPSSQGETVKLINADG